MSVGSVVGGFAVLLLAAGALWWVSAPSGLPEPPLLPAGATSESRPAEQIAPNLRGAERVAASAPAADAGLPDPDGIGPLPKAAGTVSSPVVRRGRDADGWPTWWHADGSLTKQVEQTLREPDGTPHRVPSVVRMRPGAVKKADSAPAQRPR